MDQSPAQIGKANNKPGTSGVYEGATYLVDEHFGGYAGEVFVEELYWGRLLDVYDEDPITGESNLVHRDFIVGDTVLTEFGKWRLDSNPLTGTTRLIIERKNTEDTGDAFDLLLAEAEDAVGPVLTKGLDPGESPPFSFVARNSALVVRFSDLVDPSTVSLNDSVEILVGNPPTQAFDARLLMSPNHGGIATTVNEFRSTRLIIDFTVDKNEQVVLGDPLSLNGLGLPANLEPLQPNVAIQFPTRIDPGEGKFDLLRNLKGEGLADEANGPIDITSPTLDVVRAMRSGNAGDPNNGFLADILRPSLIGTQGITIQSVSPDATGTPGFDFIISYVYDVAACGIPPAVDDVVRIDSDLSLNVTQPGTVSQGVVSGLRVSVPSFLDPVDDPSALIGLAEFRTVWREALENQNYELCFVRFTPEATTPPGSGILPSAQVVVEFSEAMDPASVRPFDTFTIARSPQITQITQFVVGDVLSSADLSTFRFVPSVGFDHTIDGSESYFIDLISDPTDAVGLSDLAGNRLDAQLPEVNFFLEPTAPSNSAGGWALTFSSENEDTVGGPDLVGQFLYDLDREEVFPRAVSRFPAIADRNNPLVGAMLQITTGVQTPLSNLGSKLHAMWRYADVGFAISQTDSTFVNVDVESVSLSPQGGSVTQTFYPQFEMLLGHSDRTPDEIVDPISLLPVYPLSGFLNNASYSENYLVDPNNTPVVVHEREKGYLVSQTEVFQSETNTPMLRFPMNVGAEPEEKVYYTWRDTAITGKGGLNAQGSNTVANQLPFDQESVIVLGIGAPPPEEDIAYPGGPDGFPSVGLPILMEFRCYPSEAISLNTFDISIAVTSSPRPFFRAFSTGGFNESGNPVPYDPDDETTPSGGFNGVPPTAPGQLALGAKTPPRDPTVYIGQLDLVTRVSRMYTTLINSSESTPDYVTLVQEPRLTDQPAGTDIQYAFRGHAGFSVPDPSYIDGEDLDVYGNDQESTTVALSVPTWDADIDTIDGARFAQIRVSFFGNPDTLLTPRLSAIALAFRP